MKGSLEEYTEQDFIDMLEQLCAGDMPEKEEDKLLRHFIRISGHPAGSDLLYYPKDDADDSPKGIARTVEEWRLANGLPGFKKS